MNLKSLAQEEWAKRILTSLTMVSDLTSPPLRDLAHGLLAMGGPDRASVMRRLVNEVHRRFVYAPDPTSKEFFSIPFEFGSTVDVDDACLFVVALAKVVGIPCRFVLARYRDRALTVFLAYQDEEGWWTGVDPLRQKTEVTIQEIMWGDTSQLAQREEVVFFSVEAEHIERLKNVARRLYTERRMDGDEMRDFAHSIMTVVRYAEALGALRGPGELYVHLYPKEKP